MNEAQRKTFVDLLRFHVRVCADLKYLISGLNAWYLSGQVIGQAVEGPPSIAFASIE